MDLIQMKILLGFIIWLNHFGIMVDPPVNSTEWLLDSNVNPKFIDSIILTHCHADHDAGDLSENPRRGQDKYLHNRNHNNSFFV